jgi:hypothetical protein
MHAKRRLFWIGTSILLFTTAACSLILDRSSDQCSTNADCAKFGATAICRDSVCVAGGDSGSFDAPPTGPVTGPDGASGDAGIHDAAFGQDGCVMVTPGATTTNAQFLNACTVADCLTFDNCAELGLCDAGLLGPDPPEAGSPPAPPGPDSGATILCSDLAADAGTNPVYVTGSSNFPPFLKAFAPVLAANSPPYSVVWQTTNSCAGVDAIYNDFSQAAPPVQDPNKTVMNEKAGRETDFYAPDGKAIPCLLSGPTPIDVGESDIYAKTCQATIKYDPTNPTAQANVGEYLGPIMAMTFVVPGTSTQALISAEAAQAVFGRGRVPDTTKLPYDDPTQFFIRASSTATNQIMSKGIFIDPTKWWGVDKRSASNMASQLKQVPLNLAEKTIGIISTDFADSERGNIKTLAFQSRGQSCGFWPDSTPFAEDKRNVRDGHYSLWGPLHFFARLSGGVPSTAAGAFVLRFSVPKLDQALVKGIVDSHNVPACAMSVTRDSEMGDMKAYEPPFSCACYFEKEATGGTSCKECPNGAPDCTDPARPACNYGYCEAR